MSNVEAIQAGLSIREPLDHESLGMYEVTKDQYARLDRMGLVGNVVDMRDKGWSIFSGGASTEFVDRLRDAIVKLAMDQKGDYFGITKNGASCDMLLDKDDLFSEAVLNEPLHEMMQIMCGANYVLSQLTGSVRFEGAEAMPLHCDQDWIPAPFSEHNALCTACWYLDDIETDKAGATKVVSGTHLKRRHPSPEEVAAEESAEPILCRKGDIALWDGRLWHSNYGRQLPGERVLLHMTFTRLSYRPIEDYGHLDDAFISTHGGDRMASLLGRNLWYGNRGYNNGAVDMSKYGHTYLSARR